MKTFLSIIFFLFFTSVSFAQDDEGGKVRERMTEYIQKRLGLSRPEAEQFGPVFLNYFNDLKRTTQDNRGDRLVLQQKIVELRLQYRDQFKNIMGEKRSNDVFKYERDFVDEVKKLRNERLMNQNQNLPNKRLRGPLQ